MTESILINPNYNQCLKCGLPLWLDSGTTTLGICHGHPDLSLPDGWTCPNCGIGMNPSVDKCDCINILKIGEYHVPTTTSDEMNDLTNSITTDEINIPFTFTGIEIFS